MSMNSTNLAGLETAPRNERFGHLLGDLEHDVKTLIKKELDLAKTEMREKFKTLGRNAGLGAAGGVLLLFALFILLLGIGAILARLLQNAGMNPGTAYFLAFTGLGLVLGAVGYALLQKAIHAFSKFSLSPEKALETMRGAEPEAVEIHHRKSENHRPSSDQLHGEVLVTRARMDSEWAELRNRLTPGYVFRSSMAGIKHHPLRALLVGAGTGLGGYLMWRQRHPKLPPRHWWQFKRGHA